MMSATHLMRRLVVLASCLFVFHRAEGFLRKAPQNVVVKKNESATLNCSTNATSSTGQNPIEWKYENTIVVHRPCIPPSSSKFVVSPSGSATDCNIRALALSPDGISGVYTCSTGSFSRAKTAVATVIVVDPVCEVVQPVVEGRRGTLMCRMTYEYQSRARQFNLPPQINVSLSWTGVPGTTVMTTADPEEFIGTLETNMTVEDATSKTIHSQTCTVTFDFSPGVGRYQYAVNTLSYPCQPTPLSSYCPSTVTVSPASGPYKAGDVLSCKSDGFPEPSYSWTDSNGTVVSTARTTAWRQGWSSLTCTATVNASETPCSLSRTVSMTGDCGRSGDGGVDNVQQRYIGGLVGMGVVIALMTVVIIVLSITIHRFRHDNQQKPPRTTAGDDNQGAQYISLDRSTLTAPIYNVVIPNQATSRDGQYEDVG